MGEITVFSAMRPFIGSIGKVQLNAIRSWLAVRPACQVVLVDDEEGTTPDAVRGLPVDVVRDVARSGLGAPLLDDLLRVGAEVARGDLLAFNTADVLLPPNFAEVALRCRELFANRSFLAVGGRYDLLEPYPLDMDAPHWYDSVRSAVQKVGKRHGHTALDLWVYPKTMRWQAPPMPIGRTGMDGWAIWQMRRSGIPVIDFSHDMMLVHQWHERALRKDPRFHEEFLECLALFQSMPENAMSLLDADWELVDGQLKRPRGLRRVHTSMSLFRPYRYLVGRLRRRKLPHLYGPAAIQRAMSLARAQGQRAQSLAS